MTTQYKWLPSEPTQEMINSLSSDLAKGIFMATYPTAWKAAPEVEQEPVMYVEKGLICYTSLADDQSYLMSVDVSYLWNHRFPEGTKFYTHPQPDQTALINQLTDELNKTEAERVKWRVMALTSQPKHSEQVELKREPLSVEQLNDIWEANEVFDDTGKVTVNISAFVRAIEKAHGIG
jgi:hypothetical protein